MRRMVLLEFSHLPVGYEEVKYIQAAKRHYFDTGIIPTQQMTIFADYQLTRSGASQERYAVVFGVQQNDNGQPCFTIYVDYNESSEYVGCRTGNGNMLYSSNVKRDTDRHRLSLSFGKLITDGIKSEADWFTWESITRTVWFFARNGYSVSGTTYAKLYSSKIFDNGILVRNFIPALDENKIPCVYDTVEGLAYYSLSGTFGYEKMDGTHIEPI